MPPCHSRTLPLLIAHRGASFAAPENTVAAIREGWKEGADGAEVDLYRTRDGRLVAIHDANTKRTTQIDLDVQSSTFEELSRLDAGSWKHPQWTGERIPTLEDVLSAVPAGKTLYIEMKGGAEILPELQRVLRACDKAREEIVLIDFKLDNLLAAKEYLSDIRKLWLVGATRADPVTQAPIYEGLPEIINQVIEAGLDGLDLHHGWPVDAITMDSLHSRGLTIAIWTVDETPIAQRWIEAGVDAITTNRPAYLRQQLSY
jgi:glycerophosphoryl diester phosphodiesterase